MLSHPKLVMTAVCKNGLPATARIKYWQRTGIYFHGNVWNEYIHPHANIEAKWDRSHREMEETDKSTNKQQEILKKNKKQLILLL